MSSGEYTSIPIGDITVIRDTRVRRELDPKQIEELAESIGRIGLIHAPVITRERVLVAGENRLEACRLLGWDRITVQYADTLDEDDLLALELEENIKRRDLPWQDQCDALLRFHELKKSVNADWTQEQTADEIGISQPTVAQQLQVARALRDKVPLVVAAPLYSVARNIVKRQVERLASDLSTSIDTAMGIDVSPDNTPIPITVADFNEWALSYSGPSFNLLHCDFPYGIGADKFNQGSAREFGGYEDTEATYWKLINTLLENRERVLGDSAHIIFWFSMRHYQKTLEALQSHLWVDPYPIIWHKSDNKGALPDPQRGPRRVYETGFLCSYGDRKIITATSNVFSGPTQRQGDHMSEKSEDMLRYFFRMFIDENTRLLDPTCGSGSALRAADSLGARSVLGLELNPEFAANATRAWNTRDARLI